MFPAKVVKKIKTQVLCAVNPPPENRADYEMMWKNMVQPCRTQMAIWRVRITCWIPKATNTHSEYVILIAFPLQQWLHESALMLRYTFFFFAKQQQQPAGLCNTETMFSLCSRNAVYKNYLGGL
jgi:hypothetical protein